MSLITQCPACTTLFKVVPDQLRVSEGWVRCGQCDEVFDANAYLQPLTVAPVLAPESSPPPSLPPAQTPVSDGYDWGPLTGVATPVPTAALPPLPVDVVPAALELDPIAVGNEDVDVDVDVPQIDPFLEQSPQELSAFHGSAPAVLDVDLDNNSDRFPKAGADQPAASGETPSFLVQRRRASRGVSRLSRSLMFLGCITLSLGLVVQLVVHDRDRIAATRPALVPFIESVCSLTGCEISALRYIDAVVIDSSSFSKAGAQTYKLQFTVKNVAAMTVATPALELTLTDTQDRALVRRVVKPEEFGSRKGTLNAGDELSATLPIQVRPSRETEKIAGYRLFAFYP